MQLTMYFPEFREKALTLSYDDGVLQDRRLIDLFDRYHLKATFNLNSGLLGREYSHRGVDHSHFKPEEIAEIYRGYEVAGHSLTHPDLTAISSEDGLKEIVQDKLELERLCGTEVTGFAYPSGKYDERVVELLRRAGFQYARTVEETEDFALPECFLKWQSTCRHTNPNLFDIIDRFLSEDGLKLFYLWGHSYEFDIFRDWERMEKFCRMAADRPEIWYAENREVVEYIQAFRSLVNEGARIYNPSRTAVYLAADDRRIVLKGREYVCFD